MHHSDQAISQLYPCAWRSLQPQLRVLVSEEICYQVKTPDDMRQRGLSQAKASRSSDNTGSDQQPDQPYIEQAFIRLDEHVNPRSKSRLDWLHRAGGTSQLSPHFTRNETPHQAQPS
ncbi:hypothetical protein OPT61_g2455 [Boeremia exigua]|uniref:Uncharacterized protein n=1 Tax=Boeremia exigua TaxID=749465 RepID=A0ACC2ILG5_9PLEO|nr:hypothetical protein OPT61_g2455 [Boeremia exigua]